MAIPLRSFRCAVLCTAILVACAPGDEDHCVRGHGLRAALMPPNSRVSVEVYLAVQKFDTPTSGSSESLRFEKAYQLVHRGNVWEAAREARVRETGPPPAAGASSKT